MKKICEDQVIYKELNKIVTIASLIGNYNKEEIETNMAMAELEYSYSVQKLRDSVKKKDMDSAIYDNEFIDLTNLVERICLESFMWIMADQPYRKEDRKERLSKLVVKYLSKTNQKIDEFINLKN